MTDDTPAELVKVSRTVLEDVALEAESLADIIEGQGDHSTAETLRRHIAAPLKAELGMA